MTDIDHDTLRRLAGESVRRWALELAKRLSVDDSWRLTLAATISTMQAEHSPEEIARLLRQCADLVEGGALRRDQQH
jgi:hypothetical protein